MDNNEHDVHVHYDGGTLARITPLSSEAKEWVDENVDAPDYMWIGNSFHCEPRYLENLVLGMQDDGLTVSGSGVAI